MTYFISLYSCLIWWQIEYDNGFASIKKIVEAIREDDDSANQARDFLFDSLIKNNVLIGCYYEQEDRFQVARPDMPVSKTQDDMEGMKTYQSVAVLEEFQYRLHNRVYQITINLN